MPLTFLDLPGEIRNQVYEFICDNSQEDPLTSNRARLNILQTCRQIYSEAQILMFRRTHHVFTSSMFVACKALDKLTSTQRNAIHSLVFTGVQKPFPDFDVQRYVTPWHLSLRWVRMTHLGGGPKLVPRNDVLRITRAMRSKAIFPSLDRILIVFHTNDEPQFKYLVRNFMDYFDRSWRNCKLGGQHQKWWDHLDTVSGSNELIVRYGDFLYPGERRELGRLIFLKVRNIDMGKEAEMGVRVGKIYMVSNPQLPN
ncbi:hypothetical protein EV356DRAFT_253210 [Viridothelium virens]|uniref:F-box domain-containing protein n=1 Tax=Viridothelium virens TaxID=1048519 RepID=A0A6A6H2V9_VIRVR|nr:hypothetical protein EV356DRAFT_253210 [Viridothelium virens]